MNFASPTTDLAPNPERTREITSVKGTLRRATPALDTVDFPHFFAPNACRTWWLNSSITVSSTKRELFFLVLRTRKL